jgi:hypothetical protein
MPRAVRLSAKTLGAPVDGTMPPRDANGYRYAKGEPSMAKLRVDFFSISLDGYGAGPNQSLDSPLGVGGEALHDWFVVTRSFHQVTGQGRAAHDHRSC